MIRIKQNDWNLVLVFLIILLIFSQGGESLTGQWKIRIRYSGKHHDIGLVNLHILFGLVSDGLFVLLDPGCAPVCPLILSHNTFYSEE